MAAKPHITGALVASLVSPALVLGSPATLAQTTAAPPFRTITTINPPPVAVREPRRVRTLPAPDASRDAGAVGTFRTRIDPAVRGRSPVQATPANASAILRPGTAAAPQQSGLIGRGAGDTAGTEADAREVDEARPTIIDQRSETDRAPFDSPPAGYDPAAFATEVAPRLDRRPGQLARLDPYAPTGIRMGSFVIYPEVEAGGLWTSNVFNAPAARDDVAGELRPSVRAVSNWRRHAAEVTASGGFTFFDEFDSEDTRALRLESRGRLDITRRTNIESLFAYNLSQEERGSADSTVGAVDRADIVTTTSAVTFNHRFNRLTVQLRGLVEDVDAGQSTAIAGGAITNDDQDQTTYSGAGRLTWEFKPTLFVFGEIEVARRDFERAALSDGIRRDADGRRYRVGLSFGNTSEILRGEVSIGYGSEDLDDPRLRDVDGVLVDANLAWRATRLTSVLLSARSDIDTTRVAGSGGARDNQVGVELRHAPRRNVVGSAGIGYGRRDYDGVSLLEQTWTANLGLEYFANRNVSVFARYQHTWFDSNAFNADYEADVVRIGMRLRR